jgi:hypothetical protein
MMAVFVCLFRPKHFHKEKRAKKKGTLNSREFSLARIKWPMWNWPNSLCRASYPGCRLCRFFALFFCVIVTCLIMPALLFFKEI